jgi:hypothetical protein
MPISLVLTAKWRPYGRGEYATLVRPKAGVINVKSRFGRSEFISGERIGLNGALEWKRHLSIRRMIARLRIEWLLSQLPLAFTSRPLLKGIFCGIEHGHCY